MKNISIETISKDAAKRASQALSQLINMPVKLEIVKTRTIKIKDIASILAFPEKIVSVVILPIVGDSKGSSALIFPFQESSYFAELILCETKRSIDKLDDFTISIFTEVANIIGGAFLSEISNQTNFSVIQSVPEFFTDSIKKVIDLMVAKIDHQNFSDLSTAFEIDFSLTTTTTTTTTTTETKIFDIHYVFILEEKFLKKIFNQS